MRDLFRGELVCLCCESLETLATLGAGWERDSEYHRLSDGEPAVLRSVKKTREQLEERTGKLEDDYYFFSIRTLAENVPIGVTMVRVGWVNADGIIGIAIGDRDRWGKGFGTDAIRLLVQYAFLELNLRRVTLGVNAYNARAIRSYEKVGFVREGVFRGDVKRENQRFDSLMMGLLHEEWLALKDRAA